MNWMNLFEKMGAQKCERDRCNEPLHRKREGGGVMTYPFTIKYIQMPNTFLQKWCVTVIPFFEDPNYMSEIQ